MHNSFKKGLAWWHGWHETAISCQPCQPPTKGLAWTWDRAAFIRGIFETMPTMPTMPALFKHFSSKRVGDIQYPTSQQEWENQP